MSMIHLILPALALLIGPAGLYAEAILRAGAARVDITPAEGSALPMSGYAGRQEGFRRIHDRLYARAIVVDDGSRRAAIVSCDLSAVSAPLWEHMSRRMAKESGVPAGNILIAATHTHAGPSLGQSSDDDPDARVTAYAALVEDRLVEALGIAVKALQPARIGAGAGRANVSINRQAPQVRGGFWLGRNPEGPSDKTLAVIKLESAAGDPIAIFMNYAVHCTMLGSKNLQVSADLAGAASRFVEQALGDRAVAVWTSGAGADQAPIYNQLVDFDELDIVGKILGEEALRVAGSLRMSERGFIRTAQRIVTCPGKKVPSGSRRSIPLDYKAEDAGPVDIRLSLLRINDIALAGVSGEVLTLIGRRLKAESPLANTIMVTHCNGSSGYLPDEESFKHFSYETVSARVKPGCAEQAIVDGVLELIDRH